MSMSKTGKKVKSVNCDSIDLTYNEIYDVFIDSDEYEFIIDDIGDKRYVRVDDKDYYELVDDVAEANNTTDDIHNTNETKLKFKVGDKVRVVDSNYISIFTNKVKLDDVGVINFVDNDYSSNPYRVKFDETDVRNEWWFTDKCIELVVDDSNTIENENTPIKSDGTKSNYTNTGKKFMCINSNRRDLTYKKVYDVFTNQDSAEFIIDDVGDKRYESLEFPYWCEKFDGMVDKANETKPKFKEGDRVRVVNTDYISAYDAGVRVGDIGTVIESGVDKYHVKFEGTGYDCDWFFTDNCIELVGDKHDNGNNYILDDVDDEQPKQQFSVGDKVKVVDTGYISQATSDIKVGDVGVITYIDSDYVMSPYRVEFDDDYRWFTDKCIELVNDDTIENNPTENTPIKSDGSQIVSDGGSSSYYVQQIPKGMLERFNTTGTIEAKDVIRLFLGNDFNMGNIFKAYCRIISLRNGKGKVGVDEQYDLTKAKYFTEDELNYYLENTDAETRN